MDKFKQYDIAFGGLSLGKHQFDFDIDNKFFDQFENAVVNNGNLHATIELDKQSQLLTFDFVINGSIKVECDRCCDEFDLPIAIQEQMLVKYGEKAHEEDLDVFVIPSTETHLNIAQQLYEYIAVAKPMHVVHPDNAKGKSTCNADFLKNLDTFNERKREEKANQTDPRWDVLKFLKN